MEYQAVAKYIKISPRKVRLVADAIKDLPIDKVTDSLEGLNNRASKPLLKVIKSAVSNAVNNGGASKTDISIKKINITEGIRYKRYHYAGRGRIRPYVRRTSHINVVVADKNNRENNKVKTKGKEASV